MFLMAFMLAVPPVGLVPPSHSFALFGPDRPALDASGPSARTTVERATVSLARPPGAIPRLHTEGTLPGHGIRDISIVAKKDQLIVLDLATAWRLTGDRRYLDAVTRYLDAWVSIYEISFNPIDETGFDTMIMAGDLAGANLPAALHDKLALFWRRMAEGYLDAMEHGAVNGKSNWQSHRVKLATMAAFSIGDARLVVRARRAFQQQIADNVLADGSVFDFHDRDALHYVTYDLDPLLMAALSAKAHGEDWFRWRSPTGSSLQSAMDWLKPYAAGKVAHVEFARSQIRFDRERADAGDKEYAPHLWDRANAVRPFAVAALCDPSYQDFAQNLSQQTGRQPSAWIRLFRW